MMILVTGVDSRGHATISGGALRRRPNSCQEPAMVPDPNKQFLLVVSHGNQAFPLSRVVMGNDQAGWTSANRRVAVWAWPENHRLPAEGHLQLQLGGHGPRKGHFIAIDIDSLGHGSIKQDDFGLAPVYVAAQRGFFFAANRPELIASAWHRMGGLPPQRDRIFGSLLALKGYPMGDRTGYAGVRCVPFLAFLRVTPDTSVPLNCRTNSTGCPSVQAPVNRRRSKARTKAGFSRTG